MITRVKVFEQKRLQRSFLVKTNFNNKEKKKTKKKMRFFFPKLYKTLNAHTKGKEKKMYFDASLLKRSPKVF